MYFPSTMFSVHVSQHLRTHCVTVVETFCSDRDTYQNLDLMLYIFKKEEKSSL